MAIVPCTPTVVTALVASLKKLVPTPVIVAEPLVTETTPLVLFLIVALTLPDNVVLITLTALGNVIVGLKPAVTTSTVSDVID